MGYAPGQRHTNTQGKANIEQRRKLVAINLLGGLTYAEIGRALNVSKATIASDYKAILAEWRLHYAAKADEYLSLQLRRLDTLLNALWDDAKGGNLAKLDRVLAIMDRQSTLLGLSKGITVNTNPIAPIQVIEVYHASEEDSPLMLELGE